MPGANRVFPEVMAIQNRLRILVVAGDPLVLLGMERLFGECKDFQLCGAASSAAQAREIFHRDHPEVTAIDLAPELGLTLELVKEFSTGAAGARCVAMSERFDTDLVERLLHAGVVGCIARPAALADLREACLHASPKHPWVSLGMVEAVMVSLADGHLHLADSAHPSLSDRESDVFRLLGVGRSVIEIATALGISPKTVETHCERMKLKLHLPSIDQLRGRAKEGQDLEGGSPKLGNGRRE